MQSAHELQLNNGRTIRYLLYLPDDYAADSKRLWPFILFLHGRGESGTNAEIVRKVGLPLLLETQPDFPCIVLSPQCPEVVRWPTQEANLIALLDAVLPTLRVDLQRIYLTGLSMGGEGTWFLGSLYPERFAALLPICGRKPPEDKDFPEKVCALKDVPVWVFHGAKDENIPVEHSMEMAKLLEDCGGNVKLTIFPDKDHYCWDQVYEDQAVWDWLLGQKKN